MSRSPEQRMRRARQYLAQGQLAPARTQWEMLVTEAPTQPATLLLGAQIAWQENRIRDATRLMLDAYGAIPDDPPLLREAIEALLQVGEIVAARDCISRLASVAGETGEWLLPLADFRQRIGEHAASLALIEQAVARGAGGPVVEFHRGVQLYFDGRIAQAEAALERSLRGNPANGRAAYTLSRLRTQREDRNHLQLLQDGLQRVARGSRDHAALEFARYEELEDLGRLEDAWQALASANAIMRARNPYETQTDVAFFDHLIAATGPDSVRPVQVAHTGPQPIFVLGLARSGTTVLERMLGSHSEVESAGERTDFGAQLQWVADTRNTHGAAYLEKLASLDHAELGSRYLAQTQWRARGKPYFIDKQPPNWEMAGLIRAALPRAKILHLVRDPMDVCFSNWRAFFGDTYGYSYDLATLGAYHQAYRRVMAHWHELMPGAILDVPYAELVNDPEAMVRKVFAFCGLAWEPACIDMRRNSAPVATLSAAQVREPLHRNAFGEWRHYATHLGPLQRALEAA